MKLCYFILIFILLLFSNEASSNDKQRLRKILRLIKKEENIIREELKNKDSPILRWKLMTIYQEKFEIINKLENKSYLGADVKLVRKKGKGYFFSRSRRVYKEIRKIGIFTVKNWPDFEGNDRIYYALASAALDSHYQKDIKKNVGHFLKQGLTTARQGSKTQSQLLIKLADYYYDQKKYKKAIKYYFRVIKIKKNKWKTKHLFNLAWCMLKLNRIKEGKKYLKKSWRLSVESKKKGRRYVDYTDHVLNYFAYFLDRSDVIFIQSMWPQSEQLKHDYFLRIGESFKSVGKYKESDYFFKKALAQVEQGKDRDKIFEVNLILMDMYIELKMDKKFIVFLKKWIKKNKKTPLTKKQRKIVAKRIRVYIGVVQNRGVDSQFHFVIKSFDVLRKLIPSKKSFYLYLQGEAVFEKKKYKKALAYYKKALMDIKGDQIKKKQKLAKVIFDSMIKAIEKGRLNKKEKEKWNIYVYKKHLDMYPVNERSRSMYQRLYNIYRKRKDYKKSGKIFKKYVALYPSLKKGKKTNKKDAKNHRFMLADIVDHYINKGNFKQAKYWISFAKKGKIDVDANYLNKVSIIFGSKRLDFIKKEKKISIQNVKFKKIYDGKKINRLLRADAAYYIGQNYFKMMKTKESLAWTKKAFLLSSKKVRSIWDKDILELVLKMALIGDFTSAKELASLYFNSRCRDRYDLKNDFYNALIQYSLLSGNLEKKDLANIFAHFNKGESCGIKLSVQQKNMKVMVSIFLNYGDRRALEKLKMKYGYQRKWRDLFVKGFLGAYWEAMIAGFKESERYYFKHLVDYFKKNQGVNRELRTIVKFDEFRNKLDKKSLYKFVLHKPKKKFDENIFNKNLEKFIKIMDLFKEEVSRYIETGYPQVVYYGYDILSQRYKSLGQTILDFRPVGVEKNYEQDFLKAMKEVGDQFIAESKRIAKKLVNLMNQQEILYPSIQDKYEYNFYLDISNKRKMVRSGLKNG